MNLRVTRRISQASFLALFVYLLWSTTYPLKRFVFAKALFEIDPLLVIFTSISERVVIPGLALSFGMLLLAAVFGRFFCGWVCPLGTVFDTVGAFRKKSRVLSDSANRRMRKSKFYILGLIAAAAVFGIQAAWVFDPIVIMARFVSLNLVPAATSCLNFFFALLFKHHHAYGPLRDFYHSLKPSVLSVKAFYFQNAWTVLLFFILVCAAALFIRRFLCRALCPLGALYAAVARFAPFRRTIEKCSQCRRCKLLCRMGAIRDDLSYAQGECILCMDCVYGCPDHLTRFGWGSAARRGKSASAVGGSAISRREFIILLFSSLFLLGFKSNQTRGGPGGGVIRPPGALKEEEFVDRCIRCGNCMKVCITNGLQPAFLEAGFRGIWTPHLVPEIWYCEYRCTLCGQTCPTGAIPNLRLEEKFNLKMGVAEIDRSICFPWSEGREYIVCQEHCPLPDKAIKLQYGVVNGKAVARPCVDEDVCVGCGICQNKCPVRPVRAIRLSAKKRGIPY